MRPIPAMTTISRPQYKPVAVDTPFHLVGQMNPSHIQVQAPSPTREFHPPHQRTQIGNRSNRTQKTLDLARPNHNLNRIPFRCKALQLKHWQTKGKVWMVSLIFSGRELSNLDASEPVRSPDTLSNAQRVRTVQRKFNILEHTVLSYILASRDLRA